MRISFFTGGLPIFVAGVMLALHRHDWVILGPVFVLAILAGISNMGYSAFVYRLEPEWLELAISIVLGLIYCFIVFESRGVITLGRSANFDYLFFLMIALLPMTIIRTVVEALLSLIEKIIW